ncbi:HNH endonuclease domain-containing protein [Flammeovirga sp. OC4]|uniref:HNH endonuclease domain-containing protein n=1 Tax=Flammeovirga sp. OC4 TaxID=1382345 RepID=UPI0012E04A5D|nr:HNH endonuclease domain-containing protein [Flammeovirga sp. OC4]
MRREFQSTLKKVSTSYKFYWILGLLKCVVNQNKNEFKFAEIVVEIFCLVWYPINYYKLNFGIQDQLENIILTIKRDYHLKDDIKEHQLRDFLYSKINERDFLKYVNTLCSFVPYRFLSPWFEIRGIHDRKKNKKIIELQNSVENLPYKIDELNKKIICSEKFLEWINTDRSYVETYVLFELLKYLQARNPNVPSIINKIFRPQSRNLTTPTKLWKGFISMNPKTKSIFSCNNLYLVNDLSIDHFLPWSFVTHDQIWNLHPIEKTTNSSKNNILPSEIYTEPFILLQYDFTRYLLDQKTNIKALEDYYSLFKINRTELETIQIESFIMIFKKVYNPLIEIAESMGYEKGWRF